MTVKRPGLVLSLLPLLALIGLLIINIRLFGDSATSGPNQLALLFSAAFAAVLGIFVLGHSYKSIEEKIIQSIGVSMQAVLILLVVGVLVALWILSGVVPSMIYYGIQIVSPAWFLPLSCVVCALVSIATGSSWSTGGTVGIALMGIGKALGLPEEMTAGAIISGAYFGDKLSPLSDTTNLAPAIAGTDLFTHVRYMLITTTPSFLIALVVYLVLGLTQPPSGAELVGVAELNRALEENFFITPFAFVLPLLVVVMVARKIPALPALFIGAFLGGVYALVFQQDLIARMAGGEFSVAGAWRQVIAVAHGGMKLDSGVGAVDELLSRGGMSSMLNTVWLILMAMTFGGVMELTGMLERIAASILSLVRGTASLISATLASCLALNLTAADQYLAIVVPGHMFRDAYRKRGLAPENLSRSLEDAGTLTSVLVPWNTCGAYFSGVLGVATLSYLPYACFNFVNPLVAIAVAVLGFRIKKYQPER